MKQQGILGSSRSNNNTSSSTNNFLTLGAGDGCGVGEGAVRGSPASLSAEQADSLFLQLELGLTPGDAASKVGVVDTPLNTVTPGTSSTSEWVDCDDFLWSPNGQ